MGRKKKVINSAVQMQSQTQSKSTKVIAPAGRNPIDELIKIYIPKYIYDCPVNDDGITLMDLEMYLELQEEIVTWANGLSMQNENPEYGFIFQRLSDEDLLKLCLALSKKYGIEVIDKDSIIQRDDIVDALNEDTSEFDTEDNFDIEAYFKKLEDGEDESGSRVKVEEQSNITATFCHDINLKSVPMNADEEVSIFKEWEHGMQIYLLGIAGTPVLVESLLNAIENGYDNEELDDYDELANNFKDKEDKQFKGMKHVIKGIDEDSFSEEERIELERLTQQSSHSNIVNIAEEHKFKQIAKKMGFTMDSEYTDSETDSNEFDNDIESDFEELNDIENDFE